MDVALMARKAVFLSAGEYSDRVVYGVIIGEDLTSRMLDSIWDSAKNTAARLSREAHAKYGRGCEVNACTVLPT